MEGKGKQRVIMGGGRMVVKKEEEATEIGGEWSSDEETDDGFVEEADNNNIIETLPAQSVIKKKKLVNGVGGGRRGGSAGGAMRCCQADKCAADLSDAKPYHRRHKVCEYHAKAEVVLVAGIRQRFCQQCSRFHEVSEFDDSKRSCRRRLAGHNERRRKNTAESQAEGSSGKETGTPLKDIVYGQEDDRGRIKITIQSNYKHFQIS